MFHLPFKFCGPIFSSLFPSDSANSSAIEELRKQVNDLAQELNLVKERQALQTGMHIFGGVYVYFQFPIRRPIHFSPSVCLRGTKIIGKCFLADPVKRTFYAASEECIAKGGILSTPTSGYENDQLYDYVCQSIGPDVHIWLGINDVVTDGQWLDHSSSNVRFKNWETDITLQPDGGRSQNCAILSVTANGKWFDESCREEKASVCEFNIV